jgi:hypothetical protein
VFNRSVQLIGQIDFPGSAFSVDVSSDGQYVVGGSKAVHANQFGSGGRVELIQLPTTPTPTQLLQPHQVQLQPRYRGLLQHRGRAPHRQCGHDQWNVDPFLKLVLSINDPYSV